VNVLRNPEIFNNDLFMIFSRLFTEQSGAQNTAETLDRSYIFSSAALL
jgi:hypothetical protein